MSKQITIQLHEALVPYLQAGMDVSLDGNHLTETDGQTVTVFSVQPDGSVITEEGWVQDGWNKLEEDD